MNSEIEPRILQERTGKIIAGLGRAVEFGLDINRVRELEAKHPNLHRDFLMVHLGMKPLASYLEPVGRVYNPYAHAFSATAVESSVVMDSIDAVWNSKLVLEILEDNLELVQGVMLNVPDARNGFDIPERPGFERFVRALANDIESEEASTLEGLMLGYPEEAVSTYADFYPVIGELIGHLANVAARRGEQTVLNEPISPEMLILNERGIKEEILRLAPFSPPPPIRKVYLDMVTSVRYAEVPGTPYITFGEMAKDEELAIARTYDVSGMDFALKRFLQG